MKKERMLAIAFGGGKDAKSDPPDGDGMEYGSEGHDDGDDGSSDALASAEDLIDALHSRDAHGVVEAFQALSECASDYKPEEPEESKDGEPADEDDGSDGARDDDDSYGS